FSTEYLSHTQDDDGVTAQVLDRLTGRTYPVRAKYLIGADGARSKVAADLGLPMEGRMDIAGSMNITFTADISDLVRHRPSVLYWVVQPGSDVGGIGAGLVRMVRPWNEWLVVWGYDIAEEPPVLDEAAATAIVRNLLGVPDLDVTITGSSLWGNNEQYATRLQDGRVFCAGDAVHKHPPSNGLGSNTSIQDSYNLAWKLAAVLRGQAGGALLDTYTAERAPVARQIVLRANQSAREFSQLFEALGVTAAQSEAEMTGAIDERKANTASGAAKRAAVRRAMEIKNYEFNAHGVELGQFYASTAVVSDGAPRPAPVRDPELYYQPSTVPGSRLPHAWVGDSRRKYSTHDLAPHTGFTLFTGITGERWAEAAAKVAAALRVPVSVVVIGPGREVTDLYFDWAGLREVEEDGALLVRPDKHIGWRAARLPHDPEAALRAALSALLSREA
ncbi:MAG: 2,4-dichlorophenol 6-monooxygenase, partial [Streptomyces sp.]|nr:2,4-dichlorophenol 6-monooxygenase [Streptomyces sp.]